MPNRPRPLVSRAITWSLGSFSSGMSSKATSHFEDRYENALIDLLKKKQAGEKIAPTRGAPPPQVVNLMDALRASIDAEKKKAPAPSTQARRPAKKKAGQK
jgi:non-homologous end joining protein Ku